MNFFFEVHNDLPREAPGNNQSTKRAFKMVRNLKPDLKILDIGCGPGRQSIELARNHGCHVTALDNHQPFLDKLNRKAENEKLTDRITTVNASMFDMKFSPASFDLIWSEGAIYIYGFEKGLRDWKKFLTEGGYIVVSELSWLTPEMPQEPKEFWDKEYPAMKSVNGNLKIADECGYSVAGVFIIPDSGWEDYYGPVEKRIQNLREIYGDNPEANKVFDNETAEIALYRKYGEYYGYVFYILRANK
jgi:SAM-dependent methyltransferase